MSKLIEALVRWTEFSQRQPDEDEALQRLISGGDAPERPKIDVRYEFSRLVFDLGDVKMFNEGYQPGMTVLRFDDGETLVVKIPYEEFRSMFADYRGMFVHQVGDTKPDGLKTMRAKKKRGEDNMSSDDNDLDINI